MTRILRNVSEGIYPVHNGGFKNGESAIISSGRRAGKSTLSYYQLLYIMTINNIKFMTMDSAIVDDEPWYSVLVGSEAVAWLRTQDKSMAIEGLGSILIDAAVFDVHEKIYSMMVLKFQ